MSNTSYLVSLFIGPVQDFIAAALRTRDLWFGSHMLSEVSREAARAMNKADCRLRLIFPAQEVIDQNDANVANRIMAMVSGGPDRAEHVGKAGKEAARKKIQKFLDEAHNIARDISATSPINEDIWKIQACPDDLLELYFTAVPVNGEYQAARKRLDQLTFARKNSRGFLQSLATPENKVLFGKPKSSLDGRRETSLIDMKRQSFDWRHRIMRKLRLRTGEQLDAMGLVKRLAGGNADQFTPTTRIAVDPWIRKVRQTDTGKKSLEVICHEFGRLADRESAVITRVMGNENIYSAMPYDAGILYPGPLGASIRDSTTTEEKEKLEHLRNKILPRMWEEYSTPCPYYGMILADGDNMGELLKAAASQDDHEAISSALAKFAGEVPRLTRLWRGHCIYAGGDDVLLMVPLDKSLGLADCLQREFSRYMQEIAGKLARETPTFSVGLVMAHMQTPLGRVRRLVAESEELAKGRESDQPRNGLGIVVAPRSGVVNKVRVRWDSDNLAHFMCLVELYREELLPAGFAYELQHLSQDLPESDGDGLDTVRNLEVERILARKNIGGGDRQLDNETRQRVLCHAAGRPLAAITREHLAARWLSGHTGGADHD